jgi:hypothetical protein
LIGEATVSNPGIDRLFRGAPLEAAIPNFDPDEIDGSQRQRRPAVTTAVPGR